MWSAFTKDQLNPKLMFDAASWKRWGLVMKLGSLSCRKPSALSA
jgi:hypothetical protein